MGVEFLAGFWVVEEGAFDSQRSGKRIKRRIFTVMR